MTPLLLERPDVPPARPETSSPGPGRTAASQPRAVGQSGGLTLDELITGVWEGLATRDVVRCPACGGAMESRPAGPDGARRGACLDCGAGLG